MIGSVDFDTISGDLSVAGGRMSHLSAKSVSGDLTLDLDVDSGGRLDLLARVPQ